jgi:Uma2 family endonuclease
MQEHRDNGVRLGWLIDPQNRDAYVYRADAEPERLDDPDALRGDPLLTGFTLELDAIWTLDF